MLRLSELIQSAGRQLLRGLCIARHTMSSGNLPVHHPCNVPGKICFSVWRTLFEVRQPDSCRRMGSWPNHPCDDPNSL